MNWWNPDTFSQKIPYLESRAKIIRAIRAFFDARGYLEVETPALQHSPCMEAHIQAFKTELFNPQTPFYLHTSPEFAMKKLLVAGLPAIYQLAKTFRNEPPSKWHAPEFTLLEWYRTGLSYKDMMQETIALLRHVAPQGLHANNRTADTLAEWDIITVTDAVRKYADIDILPHLGDLAHLKLEAARIGVHISEHDDWDNALLKIIMDKIEPNIGKGAPAILCDYPISMAALSRPKPEDPRFAERFEVYACGVELCNAFGELTDATIQRERFEKEITLRKKTYGQDYPIDEDLLKALKHGLPPCSGNALGIDRLVMLATGATDVRDVQAAPIPLF